MGFPDAESDTPIHDFKLSKTHYNCDILLKYVKFQCVDNISVIT